MADPTDMTEFSDDLLGLILSHLRLPDLARCACVSRTFLRVFLDDPRLWQPACDRRWGHVTSLHTWLSPPHQSSQLPFDQQPHDQQHGKLTSFKSLYYVLDTWESLIGFWRGVGDGGLGSLVAFQWRDGYIEGVRVLPAAPVGPPANHRAVDDRRRRRYDDAHGDRHYDRHVDRLGQERSVSPYAVVRVPFLRVVPAPRDHFIPDIEYHTFRQGKAGYSQQMDASDVSCWLDADWPTHADKIMLSAGATNGSGTRGSHHRRRSYSREGGGSWVPAEVKFVSGNHLVVSAGGNQHVLGWRHGAVGNGNGNGNGLRRGLGGFYESGNRKISGSDARGTSLIDDGRLSSSLPHASSPWSSMYAHSPSSRARRASAHPPSASAHPRPSNTQAFPFSPQPCPLFTSPLSSALSSASPHTPSPAPSPSPSPSTSFPQQESPPPRRNLQFGSPSPSSPSPSSPFHSSPSPISPAPSVAAGQCDARPDEASMTRCESEQGEQGRAQGGREGEQDAEEGEQGEEQDGEQESVVQGRLKPGTQGTQGGQRKVQFQVDDLAPSGPYLVREAKASSRAGMAGRGKGKSRIAGGTADAADSDRLSSSLPNPSPAWSPSSSASLRSTSLHAPFELYQSLASRSAAAGASKAMRRQQRKERQRAAEIAEAGGVRSQLSVGNAAVEVVGERGAWGAEIGGGRGWGRGAEGRGGAGGGVGGGRGGRGKGEEEHLVRVMPNQLEPSPLCPLQGLWKVGGWAFEGRLKRYLGVCQHSSLDFILLTCTESGHLQCRRVAQYKQPPPHARAVTTTATRSSERRQRRRQARARAEGRAERSAGGSTGGRAEGRGGGSGERAAGEGAVRVDETAGGVSYEEGKERGARAGRERVEGGERRQGGGQGGGGGGGRVHVRVQAAPYSSGYSRPGKAGAIRWVADLSSFVSAPLPPKEQRLFDLKRPLFCPSQAIGETERRGGGETRERVRDQNGSSVANSSGSSDSSSSSSSSGSEESNGEESESDDSDGDKNSGNGGSSGGSRSSGQAAAAPMIPGGACRGVEREAGVEEMEEVEEREVVGMLVTVPDGDCNEGMVGCSKHPMAGRVWLYASGGFGYWSAHTDYVIDYRRVWHRGKLCHDATPAWALEVASLSAFASSLSALPPLFWQSLLLSSALALSALSRLLSLPTAPSLLSPPLQAPPSQSQPPPAPVQPGMPQQRHEQQQQQQQPQQQQQQQQGVQKASTAAAAAGREGKAGGEHVSVAELQQVVGLVHALSRHVEKIQLHTRVTRRTLRDPMLQSRGKNTGSKQQVVRVVHALSWHVEKIQLHKRVTRRTLRDPMLQTSKLAEATAQQVQGLQDALVASRRESEEVQLLLLGVQDQSVRQFDLFSNSLRLLRSQQDALKAQQETLKSQQEVLRDEQERLKGERMGVWEQQDGSVRWEQVVEGMQQQLCAQQDELKAQQEVLLTQQEQVRAHLQQVRNQQEQLGAQQEEVGAEREQLQAEQEGIRSAQEGLLGAQEKLLSLLAAVQQRHEDQQGSSSSGGVSAPIDLASLQQMREQQQALAKEQEALVKEQERLNKEQEEVKREQERVGRKQREVEREQRRMEEYQRQLAGRLLAAVVAVEELRRERWVGGERRVAGVSGMGEGGDTGGDDSAADAGGDATGTAAGDAANGRAGGAAASPSSPSAPLEASPPAVDYWAE
ncbi:unnamed protein product [Closterium sp. NIES-65]|nr:unnamed protein product [Closterium sp. NIES-65]